MGDTVRDSSGREYVVVWNGTADRLEQCFSLTGDIQQSKYAKEDRTRGATLTGYIRSNGPVYKGSVK